MAAPPAEKAATPPAEKAATPPAEKAAVAVKVDPSKVSTFAPAEDLVSQVDEYLEEFAESVESEEEYGDSKENLGKDANTLILIALALGMHDTENKYQKAAPALIKASQQLATAADYATAKTGVEAVKAAAATDGDPATLKWEKVASLQELMEAVPLSRSGLAGVRSGRK